MPMMATLSLIMKNFFKGALIACALFLSTSAFAEEELLKHRMKYDEVLLTVEVVRVIDGDSFKVLLDGKPESIRILCIDTPERGEPGYQEEGDKLRARIAGKTIKIKTNKYHKNGNYLRDKYGRILAEIHDPVAKACPEKS